MTMKTISILIPAYNEEPVLKKLYIRLLKLAQNTPAYNFEFLFVNDGSKDATLDMIRHFADTDERV